MIQRAILIAALIGCGGRHEQETTPAVDSGTTAVCAQYEKSGPFVAGVTTVTINGAVTEVWYPADRGAEAGKKRDAYDMRNWLPAAERGKIPDADTPLHTTDAYRDLPISKSGKYPIVLFSHGLGGYRLQSSFLMTHLATWGFVVAAPDHAERGLALVLEGDLSKIEDKAPAQLKSALDYLLKDARFAPSVEGARIAAIGHSMGGSAVSTLIDEASIGAGVWLASGGFGESPVGKSILLMWGTADRVARATTVEQSFDKQPAGAKGIAVKDAGHMAFTDLCVVGRDRGGVLKIAVDHGIKVDDLVRQLASDGCGTQPGGASYLAPEQGWPVINHYVTAQLRAAFGIDGPSSNDGRQCFGDRVAALKTQ